MTPTTQEVFARYEVRKTKKQKNAFLEFVKGVAEKEGYSYRMEEKGAVRNFVVGDIQEAKVVYTAHYDTCPGLPFPNFITPKNIFLYLLYQLAITLALLAVPFIAGFIAGFCTAIFGWDLETVQTVLFYLEFIYFILVFYLLLKGPANPHTANDNTSGVTTLLDLMQTMPKELRNRAAFVFFDLEEVGLVGSSQFAKKHKTEMKHKLLINFDCVSDGKFMLFAMKKKALPYQTVLETAFPTTPAMERECASKGIICPSDQAKFPLGVGVAALKKTKGGLLYMNRIHTKHDTVYQEENIAYLVEGSIRLTQLL